MKRRISAAVILSLALMLSGCAKEPAAAASLSHPNGNTEQQMMKSAAAASKQVREQLAKQKKQQEEAEKQKQEEAALKASKADIVIVIDAGHQAKGNSQTEAIGPGASEKKPKVSSGTSGCATGIHEYELNLNVSLQLEAELQKRGYTVLMTRSTHDVDLSNMERAEIANNADADAFVRIHANGSDNSSQTGAFTMCMTKNNPYNGKLYKKSRALAEAVSDGYCRETGAKQCSIQEVDNMSGINWSKVPVTILEMGFMSNPQEDKRLNDPDYQKKAVKGIADGLEAYFAK